MKKVHNDNLMALRDALSTQTLPSMFDMRWYFHNSDNIIGAYQASNLNQKDLEQCSTCALGASLFVSDLPKPDKKTKSWGAYGTSLYGVEPFTIAWDFLFSPQWYTHDNTTQGASDRINYFIQHCQHKSRREVYEILSGREFDPTLYSCLPT